MCKAVFYKLVSPQHRASYCRVSSFCTTHLTPKSFPPGGSLVPPTASAPFQSHSSRHSFCSSSSTNITMIVSLCSTSLALLQAWSDGELPQVYNDRNGGGYFPPPPSAKPQGRKIHSETQIPQLKTTPTPCSAQ